MARQRLDGSDVIAALRAECERAGSIRQWARAHGVTDAYAGDVLAGRRAPGPAILAALGLRRVPPSEPMYEPLDAT